MKQFYLRYAPSMLTGVGFLFGWNHLSAQTDCTLHTGLTLLWHVLGCTHN